MRMFVISLLLMVLLSFSCKNRAATEDNDVKNNKSRDSVINPIGNSVINPVYDSIAKSSSSRTNLKVSAYLIYEDGTLSSFDVLNDKTMALWNVVAGGGDALKPSGSTKINLDGDLDSFMIRIKNGRRLAIDTSIIHFNKHLEYIIKYTGCAEVYVNVTRRKKLVYNDTIHYHCGE